MYCFGYHFLSLQLYTIALFLPSIIANLGYSAADAQLLTIPPYALAALLTVCVAWTSEYVGRRAPFLIGGATVAIIGYCILLSNKDPTSRPGVSYVGTFFAAAGIYPSVGLILSWPGKNSGRSNVSSSTTLANTSSHSYQRRRTDKKSCGQCNADYHWKLRSRNWNSDLPVGHQSSVHTRQQHCFGLLCGFDLPDKSYMVVSGAREQEETGCRAWRRRFRWSGWAEERR